MKVHLLWAVVLLLPSCVVAPGPGRYAYHADYGYCGPSYYQGSPWGPGYAVTPLW